MRGGSADEYERGFLFRVRASFERSGHWDGRERRRLNLVAALHSDEELRVRKSRPFRFSAGNSRTK